MESNTRSIFQGNLVSCLSAQLQNQDLIHGQSEKRNQDVATLFFPISQASWNFSACMFQHPVINPQSPPRITELLETNISQPINYSRNSEKYPVVLGNQLGQGNVSECSKSESELSEKRWSNNSSPNLEQLTNENCQVKT